MDTFMALHPSYTLTITLPSNIKAALGRIVDGTTVAVRSIKFNKLAELLATMSVRESATEPKLTTQNPYTRLPSTYTPRNLSRKNMEGLYCWSKLMVYWLLVYWLLVYWLLVNSVLVNS